MKSTRRPGSSGAYPSRTTTTRLHGRITREDIRAANLRRWDGRSRITTDWVNLFQEPELYFPTGDILVYLREPGQSSRGPAFRVHKAQLAEHGFYAIVSKCIESAPLPNTARCTGISCIGCKNHQPPSELYIPAPQGADLDMMFDHHITTRNFLAWLYRLPLAGRALGKSLVALKDRINFYRPGDSSQTIHDVVSYAESQRYLDFRECVDHALAALHLAESLQLEDLWVDAFAHCVGLSHRGLHSSVEYPVITHASRVLVNKARLEMEGRLDRVSSCVENFFENDLSGNFFGLSQAARDHFDRFRSWLHAYYIEQHGFWPPDGFEDETVQRNVYISMYSDFRNLYHHLADLESSSIMGENVLAGSGGVCALQNVQAFDARHKYDALPQPLPMIPVEPSADARAFGLQRRKSWNPMTSRKISRDNRNILRAQALITASNRDWSIMDCLLVRRYSEYETQTVMDELDHVSIVDGRKVRWVLIYAILQTLISIMQAPTQVRNTEGLTYHLCCHVPETMPWSRASSPGPMQNNTTNNRLSRIEPDMDFRHSNVPSDLPARSPVEAPKVERRQTLPSRLASLSTLSTRSQSAKPSSRSSSLRRLVTRRNSAVSDVPSLPTPTTPFCEILVHGYGNGLNEVTHDNDDVIRSSTLTIDTSNKPMISVSVGDEDQPVSPLDSVPELISPSSASVSRESSNASNNSAWSRGSVSSAENSDPESDVPTLTAKRQLPLSLEGMLQKTRITQSNLTQSPMAEDHPQPKELDKALGERSLLESTHMSTDAMDQFLGVL